MPRAARPCPGSARCAKSRQLLFASLLLADQMVDEADGGSGAPCPDPALVERAEAIAERLESLADALEDEAVDA